MKIVCLFEWRSKVKNSRHDCTRSCAPIKLWVTVHSLDCCNHSVRFVEFLLNMIAYKNVCLFEWREKVKNSRHNCTRSCVPIILLVTVHKLIVYNLFFIFWEANFTKIRNFKIRLKKHFLTF